jgi:hypothetical protein
MQGAFDRIGHWLVKKLGGGAVIIALGVGLTWAWMYFRDTLDFEQRRASLLQVISGERRHLEEARGEVLRRKQGLEQELQTQQERARTAARAQRSLNELESSWDYLFGDRQAQRGYSRRIEALKEEEHRAGKRAEELVRTVQIEAYTLDGLDLAMGKLDAKRETVEKTESKFMHYVRSAWERVRWHVLAAVALWILGPLLLSLLFYYGFAPWVGRRRPIRLRAISTALPEIAESLVAVELELQPGETLRVKESHLQASDEGLGKRVRFLFDWRFPFVSIAARLTEMTELHHGGIEGTRRVTIANAKDPLAELSLVRIPEGASLVLRPIFIAGVVLPSGRRPEIRSHWVFARWQAWMTLQFRYLEFRGPMQILVSGGRGVRIERLDSPGREAGAARRVNSGTLIGFTPTLDYQPVRAETFWSYYRGQNPLFDDLFSGSGFFLCQSSGSTTTSGERFWSGLGRAILRVAGF